MSRVSRKMSDFASIGMLLHGLGEGLALEFDAEEECFWLAGPGMGATGSRCTIKPHIPKAKDFR